MPVACASSCSIVAFSTTDLEYSGEDLVAWPSARGQEES
jgi:hypothetical protein